jgi:hypothetical protein
MAKPTAGFHPCSGKSNPALTLPEMAAVALTAGFSADKNVTVVGGGIAGKFTPAAVIIAIASKESGGHICARNRNRNGSLDRGILQFNDRAHREVSDDCAFTPQCAFREALRVSKQGTDWSAWNGPTYTNHVPLTAIPFLLPAEAAVASGHPNTFERTADKVGDVVGGIGAAFTGFVNLIAALFRGSTWIRTAEIVGGMVLIATGIWLISRDLGLSAIEEKTRKVAVPNLAKKAGVKLTVPYSQRKS